MGSVSSARAPNRAWWVLPKSAAVVTGSFLVANTVNAVIAHGAGSAAGESVTAATRTVPPARQKSLEYFLGPVVRRNIFQHGEPIPGEEAPDPAASAGIEEGCTLPIQVLASVVVRGSPDLSLATLLDTATKRIVVVQVGERVGDDATLTEVQEPFDETALRKESVAVFLRDDGARVVCRSDDAPQKAILSGKPGMVAAPTGAGIRRVADNQYEIPQAEIDAVMNGGLATIATTVRVVPYFEAGKSAGFKLYSVKAGSLLSKMGLVNGDVLRKVNGYEISSPEKALEVYGILKSERNVSLDISRGGKPRTLQYSIR